MFGLGGVIVLGRIRVNDVNELFRWLCTGWIVKNTKIFSQDDAHENVVWKMAAILILPQFVETASTYSSHWLVVPVHYPYSPGWGPCTWMGSLMIGKPLLVLASFRITTLPLGQTLVWVKQSWRIWLIQENVVRLTVLRGMVHNDQAGVTFAWRFYYRYSFLLMHQGRTYCIRR